MPVTKWNTLGVSTAYYKPDPFSMEDTIEKANIAARYENGVLYLQLPKKEEAQKIFLTHTIKIFPDQGT
jgi:hypothetical protein